MYQRDLFDAMLRRPYLLAASLKPIRAKDHEPNPAPDRLRQRYAGKNFPLYRVIAQCDGGSPERPGQNGR